MVDNDKLLAVGENALTIPKRRERYFEESRGFSGRCLKVSATSFSEKTYFLPA